MSAPDRCLTWKLCSFEGIGLMLFRTGPQYCIASIQPTNFEMASEYKTIKRPLCNLIQIFLKLISKFKKRECTEVH